MAIYHLSVKNGKQYGSSGSRGASHYAYINRDGKYKRDDFIKIDTKEMIYDDLNKIAKNSSPFKAEYYAHKYNGENLYLESEKNIINSKNTHFEIDIEKRKGKDDKK